jgi:hypothetical protein
MQFALRRKSITNLWGQVFTLAFTKKVSSFPPLRPVSPYNRLRELKMCYKSYSLKKSSFRERTIKSCQVMATRRLSLPGSGGSKRSIECCLTKTIIRPSGAPKERPFFS